jgi:hypothetical protein
VALGDVIGGAHLLVQPVLWALALAGEQPCKAASLRPMPAT